MRKRSYSLHSLQKRLLVFILLIIFLFVFLFGRLFFIQLIKGKSLQAKAVDQWTRDLPIKAERGAFLDCNGVSLAVSYTTYDIYVRSREVTDAVKVATILSEKLNLEFEKIFKKVSNKNTSESLIKLQVEKELAMEIVESNLEGIYLSESINRYYPYGDLLTQVIGFTSVDGSGQSGLEKYYNDYLKGLNGYSLVQSDLQGKKLDDKIELYVPAVKGLNVNLTIDVNIQLSVEKILNQVMEEQKPKSATCVVMDPNTGNILAMSTKPSFNLNEPPRLDVASLFASVKNQALVDVYEPGSTFKILTMASALESKVTTLNDNFFDPGYRMIDGQRIKCWKHGGHKNQTLTEGFCNSCNSVFMDLALRMGTEKFYNYLKNFGIGQKTNIEFDGESSGIVMKEENVKTVDLARIGFGQAIAVTPLQLITAVSSVVNGGKLFTPKLISSITSDSGEVVYNSSSEVIRNTISSETSKIINSMMESAVNKTGLNTFVPGYSIGGKTGTAQKYENGAIAQGKYISSFIGTFPANNPEYVVLLLVDEPSQGAYFGSVVAAPYAKEVFKSIIDYKGYNPVNYIEDLTKLQKNITMPNVVSLTVEEAISVLEKLELYVEIDGEGDVVTSQLPPAGTKLYKNQTVIISTS